MWYVSCCCALLCSCSIKVSYGPYSSDWHWLFLLFSIVSWSSCWTSTVLPFLSHFLLISSITMNVSHLFVWICLAWSENPYSVKQNTHISSHIFLFVVYIVFMGSLLSNTKLQFCLLPFPISSHFSQSVASWRPVKTRSGTACMPRVIPSPLVPLILLTLLFSILSFDISLYLRLLLLLLLFLLFTKRIRFC